MKNISVKFIEVGSDPNNLIPLNIVFINKADIEKTGKSDEEVIYAVAKEIDGPTGINIFDMDAITTTSDGIVVEGAIVKMAAADIGTVHKEFGILEMQEMELTDDLLEHEPHLKQWKELFPNKKLFRGPNPDKKLIPVHNVVMTGRAVNNNSATEMMNAVSMEEILLPILGQLQIMGDDRIMIGITGQDISVGIGMTIAEKYGRIFPTRQFYAGDTAHGSGEYAKTLKEHIPIIAAPKSVLAENIIRALDIGMIPGRHIGCSPAVLSVAEAYGSTIDFDNITEGARKELASVGIDLESFKNSKKHMSKEEILENANEIIPGILDSLELDVSEIAINKVITLD